MKQLTVAICIDERRGMLFGGRRQSRDRVLIADLVETAQDLPLCIDRFSKTLFDQYPNTRICEDLFADCPANSICFVENIPLLPYLEEIDTLILYHWNRHYPADVHLDLEPLANGFSLLSRTEFTGSSHNTITKEVYRKA